MSDTPNIEEFAQWFAGRHDTTIRYDPEYQCFFVKLGVLWHLDDGHATLNCLCVALDRAGLGQTYDETMDAIARVAELLPKPPDGAWTCVARIRGAWPKPLEWYAA